MDNNMNENFNSIVHMNEQIANESRITPSGDTFFLTITLKPTIYEYSSVTQYEMTRGALLKIFSSAQSFVMVPEHTGTGNIHYHALVQFRDTITRINIINRLKRNKFIGFIKVNSKPVKSEKYFRNEIKYIIKKVHENVKILGITGPRIVYNEFWNNPI